MDGKALHPIGDPGARLKRSLKRSGPARVGAMESICLNGEVGDWRLADSDFLSAFALPQRRPDTLAKLNPFAQDEHIHFDEPSHTYTFKGQVVPRSVTGLLHEFANEFDPMSAVAAMKRGPEWEMKRVLLEAEGLGTTDSDFLQRWAENGKVQRARGTLMHFQCDGGVKILLFMLPWALPLTIRSLSHESHESTGVHGERHPGRGALQP